MLQIVLLLFCDQLLCLYKNSGQKEFSSSLKSFKIQLIVNDYSNGVIVLDIDIWFLFLFFLMFAVRYLIRPLFQLSVWFPLFLFSLNFIKGQTVSISSKIRYIKNYSCALLTLQYQLKKVHFINKKNKNMYLIDNS